MITLGCRLNIAESENIRSLLGTRDVVVVNSCAVTNEAVRATRAAIRRARRDAAGRRTGGDGLRGDDRPGGVRRDARGRPGGRQFRASCRAGALGRDIACATAPPGALRGHARAFVEVQNGCDHRCTFCAIPFGRGDSRSIPAGAVVERIAALVDAGHNEVVLTGVDLTSYGADLPGAPTLGHLVERILKLVPALPRLRLSSLDGIEIDDRLFALLTRSRG